MSITFQLANEEIMRFDISQSNHVFHLNVHQMNGFVNCCVSRDLEKNMI